MVDSIDGVYILEKIKKKHRRGKNADNGGSHRLYRRGC
jgi:hypothetical protein